jgi:hypothetical protein
MEKTIELTIDEALTILKALSHVEGYLFGINHHGTDILFENIDYPIDILTNKLGGKT